MKRHQGIISKLKKQRETEKVTLNVPKDLHDEIMAIVEESQADKTAVIVTLLRLALKEAK